MPKIVVIGTGTMAAGIAAGFIAQQYSVVILGRTLEKANSCLTKAVSLAQGVGQPNMQHQTGLIEAWDAWDNCIWVIETVTENLAIKQTIFKALDARVPTGIPIGSNSSGFPISKIAEGLPTASRMMGAHYFMPADIVPLVEIVMGEKTDPLLAEQVCALYKSIQKKPVLVKRDIPGFLANRIQHALMREALALVDAGIATPDDIDDAVRYSFGFRYAAVGPMTQKEISGWDGMANAAKEIYPSLSNIDAIPPSLAKLMAEGKTGIKAGEGFRKWSPKESKAVNEQYTRRLKAAFDVLQME
ncbi:3-hydroxyacyl-CoA dehydrogenase NAD-binding domain-containing protein [Polynucleobacter sp.]|uniref:3-hydroxyacyl-CoA dehydrogenase NAD-binding domain-containing protein n=1 Tax=Polynucleobacter sp. TaxID=2029855 RepID=UPI002735FE53|nr:3-hydroxyacyl-CoA dehydrogenase NAD-binding domain-containing protein [Polynucleobacter sp.]MDP3121356.1 3-hydroxyacyl-CoA dehydrogenase NAD-binding domain-containing protein [Polynucleobacter sp.]